MKQKSINSRWFPELIRQIKYNAFFVGSVPQWLLYVSRIPGTGTALLGGKVAAIRDRRFFVNRYGPATAGKPRLSFSYYELDVSKLPQALPAILAHAANFRERTGWSPRALAIYFVKRDGIQGESNYGGPPGVSCTLDPVTVKCFSFFLRERESGEGRGRNSRASGETTGGKTHSSLSLSLSKKKNATNPQGAPDDPRFPQFLAESDKLLQSFGAMLSPSQSLPSAIGPGQATNFGSLDQALITQTRFATPYLKQVWAADALWHANAGKK